jgi:hypothetical protein
MSAPPMPMTELPTWDGCAEALLAVYRSVLGPTRPSVARGTQ